MGETCAECTAQSQVRHLKVPFLEYVLTQVLLCCVMTSGSAVGITQNLLLLLPRHRQTSTNMDPPGYADQACEPRRGSLTSHMAKLDTLCVCIYIYIYICIYIYIYAVGQVGVTQVDQIPVPKRRFFAEKTSDFHESLAISSLHNSLTRVRSSVRSTVPSQCGKGLPKLWF